MDTKEINGTGNTSVAARAGITFPFPSPAVELTFKSKEDSNQSVVVVVTREAAIDLVTKITRALAEPS